MEVVSAAIKPKGRIVTQFLEYFAPLLFPEKSELISEARKILEDDKRRIKEDEFLSLDDALELFYDGICRQNPEFRTVLCVAPDLKRKSQPYRIALRTLEGYVDGINLRIYGDVNPIETLRDNNANFAIASSDLLLAKFISLIPRGTDVRDSGKILSCLPEDTTTMEYGFPLNINQARHMLITNFPADISVREDGIPLPEEGVEIAVNGEYYLIYSRIFNGRRYRLTEGEKVEPFVLRRDGMKKYGIEIVGFFMLALPGETIETMKKTIDFAIELDPDYAKATITVPFPSTQLFFDYEKEGRIKTKDWAKYNFHHTSDIYDHENLDWNTIQKYYSLFYRKFYFRPGYIWNRFVKGIRTGNIFYDIYYFFRTWGLF